MYSRSKAFSLSWPIVDLFCLLCFIAELARSVVATVTGVIAFKTPEVSRRVIWHYIIEKLVSSKAVHSKVTHVPRASKVNSCASNQLYEQKVKRFGKDPSRIQGI